MCRFRGVVVGLFAKMLADALSLPIVVGGIIPEEDKAKLLKMGISKVYTPKDFEMNTIMMDIVNLAEPREIAAE